MPRKRKMKGRSLKGKPTKEYKVKGITMSQEEYEAFVNYLNEYAVQSFSKQDVSDFLEHFSRNR